MNKPVRYLLECLIYIVMLSICLPYAVTAYVYDLYDIMYMNIAGTLIMAVMILVNLYCFVKSLIQRYRKRGERFK